MENKGVHLSHGSLILGNDQTVPDKLLIATTRNLFEWGFDLSYGKKQIYELQKNFKDNVLGQKIPIVYDHPMSAGTSTRAAGWVNDLEIDESGEDIALYATGISWTDKGKADILAKEYVYTSNGMYLNFVSRSDGKTEYGMTLYEISLTNMPADSNLNEIIKFSSDKDRSQKVEKQELESELSKVRLELSTRTNEFDSKISELSKSLETIKSEKREVEKKLELSKREKVLDQMILDKRIDPKQKDKAMELSAEGFKGFEASVPAEGNAYNDKPASGKNPDDNKAVESAVDKVMELASRRAEKDGIPLRTAVSLIKSENKELSDAFDKEYFGGDNE